MHFYLFRTTSRYFGSRWTIGHNEDKEISLTWPLNFLIILEYVLENFQAIYALWDSLGHKSQANSKSRDVPEKSVPVPSVPKKSVPVPVPSPGLASRDSSPMGSRSHCPSLLETDKECSDRADLHLRIKFRHFYPI